MALIKCPECGKEISSKADACPNCGFPLDAMEDQDDSNQTEEIKTQNLSSVSIKVICKKYWWAVLIFVVCICLIVISINISKQQQEAKYRVSFSDENEMFELLSKGKWSSNGFYFVFMMPGDKYSCTYKYVDVKGEFDTAYENVTLDYSKGRIRLKASDTYYDIIEYKGNYYLRLNPNLDPETELREKNYLFFKLIPEN